jgi:NAD(P)-dependent dehydrogenase (short-subunit alcohol dehydrogenase family)
VVTDATNENSVDEMMAKTLDTFGKVDIMIPVGGIVERYPAEEFPIGSWQRVMAAHAGVHGPLRGRDR